MLMRRCIGNCLFISFWLKCKLRSGGWMQLDNCIRIKLKCWPRKFLCKIIAKEFRTSQKEKKLMRWPPNFCCKIIAKEFQTSQKDAKLTLTGLRPGRMWAGLAGSLGFSATGGLWIDWLVKNHELLGEENITCSQWGCSGWWSCPASRCKTPVIAMLRRMLTRSTCRPRPVSTCPSSLARTQRGSLSHKTSHPGKGIVVLGSMLWFCVLSDNFLPVELTLYSPNNRTCLKKMRFSCLVLLHCGPFGCLCFGDKKWSSVIYIWSSARVVPSVPRRCPWSDGGLVTGCLQGRCDRDVVIRGDWLHGWALEQMNIDRQSRNKLKLWPNLFIVLSKVENDLGDVSGPLSLEFLTHVQHRPTIELFLFMNPTASHFFFWPQGLPCRYLSCWSFRDGLMPRLSSVLTTSTWVSIVKSVSLDIKK